MLPLGRTKRSTSRCRTSRLSVVCVTPRFKTAAAAISAALLLERSATKAHNGVARLSARCTEALARARRPRRAGSGWRRWPSRAWSASSSCPALLPRGLRLGTALADLAQHTIKQLVGHARMLPPRPDAFRQGAGLRPGEPRGGPGVAEAGGSISAFSGG